MMTAKYRNSSFYFVPFQFSGGLATFFQNAMKKSGWKEEKDDAHYLLRYISNKFYHSGGTRQILHLSLNDEDRERYFLPQKGEQVCLEKTVDYLDENGNQSRENFPFVIEKVHLVAFSTGIGILVYQLSFLKNDPIWIATANYYIKKVGNQYLRFFVCGKKRTVTLWDMSEQLIQYTVRTKIDVFFQTTKTSARANVFCYLELRNGELIGHVKEYKYYQYYLRWAYRQDGFPYIEDDRRDSEELHKAGEDLVWAITAENVSCLVYPEMGREKFIKNTFYKNYHSQYLFMYILLLHQKYALYAFLTRINTGLYENAEQLEKYKNELYLFEANFVYSRITEVPQYQQLYDKIRAAFVLADLFQDVREPINALSEARSVDIDRKQKNNDKKMSMAVFILSMLGIASFISAGFSIVQAFSDWKSMGVCARIADVMVVLIGAVVSAIVVNHIRELNKE